jgi:hypothetical protein
MPRCRCGAQSRLATSVKIVTAAQGIERLGLAAGGVVEVGEVVQQRGLAAGATCARARHCERARGSSTAD